MHPNPAHRLFSYDVNTRKQLFRKVAMFNQKNSSTRKEEARSFAFLTVVMAPVLTGLLIAAYGFMVWIYQMFAGPPQA